MCSKNEECEYWHPSEMVLSLIVLSAVIFLIVNMEISVFIFIHRFHASLEHSVLE